MTVKTSSGTTHIESFGQAEGLHGTPEVWVRVLSNSVVDWPDVERALNDAQREILKPSPRQPLNYYPHLVTPEEKAEHGFSLEDWWIFTAPTDPSGVVRVFPAPRSAT